MSIPQPIPQDLPLVGLIANRGAYPPGSLVVLYVRVSGNGWKYAKDENGKKRVRRKQRTETLGTQRESLEAYCRACRLTVIAVFEEASSGTTLEPDQRPVLWEAIRFAKECGAVLVAHDLPRFFRNEDEESKRRKSDGAGYEYKADLRFDALTPEAVATFNQFIASSGVRFATKCPSCVPSRFLGSTLTRRGLRFSPKNASRKPRERKRPLEDRSRMLDLRRGGLSFREIAERFKIAAGTARNYCREMAEQFGVSLLVPFDDSAKIRFLHQGGMTVAEIARRLNVPFSIVRRSLGKSAYGSRFGVVLFASAKAVLEAVSERVVVTTRFNSCPDFPQRNLLPEVPSIVHPVPHPLRI